MNFPKKQAKTQSFDGLVIDNPDCYHDFRGYYWTVCKDDEKIYNHDKITVSKRNVLRGIHGDFNTVKMVSCVYGEIYCVVVDKRPDSKTYDQWRWIMLSHTNRTTVKIPAGVGLSYLVTSDEATVLYKLSYRGSYQDSDNQFTYKWDDPNLGIDWPISSPILQKRDK
tara:strand:+ start:21128 stop:21628 length:501 start_codon:yes stop_codon:yes gene_type:complete